MDTTARAGTPLRQRMIEDMRMRRLEQKTQDACIRAVRKRTAFLKRSPDTATVEDLRNFQLGRGELMARMQPVKLPRTVPVVLSMQEAASLIAAARNIKHQAALSPPVLVGRKWVSLRSSAMSDATHAPGHQLTLPSGGFPVANRV